MAKTNSRMRANTNGKMSALSKKEAEEFLGFVLRTNMSQQFSRAALLERIQGGGHNLDTACGYPKVINIEDYKFLIEREGIAKRANSIYPDECFSAWPYIFETQKVEGDAQTNFEKAWSNLIIDHPIFNKLNRLDVISGYGHFGIMVIGTNDGNGLEKPFPGFLEDGSFSGEPKEHKLLYLMPYSEGEVKISKLNTNQNSPRFNRPTQYTITVSNPEFSGQGKEFPVHWSRVIHVADGCTSSDFIGTPRLEKIYNYIMNIRKIMGGSAEMFYMGGFPGTSFEVPPELVGTGEFGPEQKKDLSKQIDEYYAGFRRYIATSGIHANQLEPNIADPDTHIQIQMTALCVALEVPMRIFTGSEEARLASMNDSDAWNRRIHRRQDIHVTPNILRPTIDRFLRMGILPPLEKPNYKVEWPDVYSVSETDRADITGKLVRALGEYCSTGAFKIIPPLQFFTRFMDLTTDEAEEVISAAKKSIKEFAFLDDLIQAKGMQQPANMSNGGRRKPLGSKNKVKVGANEITINALMRCRRDGKAGFKYGKEGICYTYIQGDVDSKKEARKKAHAEGVTVELSKHLAGLEKDGEVA